MWSNSDVFTSSAKELEKIKTKFNTFFNGLKTSVQKKI